MGSADGWSSTTVGELFEIQLGKMLNKAARETQPQYPYLGNREVQWGRFDLSAMRTMHFSEKDKRKFQLLPGDLLVCEGGEVGRSALWASNEEVYYQKAIHRLRPLDEHVLPNFMLHYMRFAAGSGRLGDYTSQSSIAHLTREKLSLVPVDLPPFPEQRKIAAILSSVDEAIEKTQAVIDQVQVVKKGLMQELLTKGLPGRHKTFKQTEIGRIPEGWKVVELATLCSHVVDCLHSTPKYVDEGCPAIRTSDIAPGRLFLGQARRVSQETYTKRVSRLEPRASDILYSREGERYGIAAPVPPNVKVCLAQRMMHFRARDGVVPLFLMWLMNSPGVYRQAKDDVGGSTSPHVNIRSIRRFRVPEPPAAEQAEIAEVISSADEYQQQLERKRSSLVAVKSALMSVLLTGELRVDPDPQPTS